MIKIDLTPQSGTIVLIGSYLWDKSGNLDEVNQEISNFQVILAWNSDLMIGMTIKRIVWIDEIPEDKKPHFENEIHEVYTNLHIKPTILLTQE